MRARARFPDTRLMPKTTNHTTVDDLNRASVGKLPEHLGVKIIGDPAVKGLPYVRGPASDPQHLNENDFWCVIDAEISVVRIDQLAVSVDREDLKLVVYRHVRYVDHRGIDDIADDQPLLP